MTATMSKATLDSTLEGLVRLYYSNRGYDLAASKAEVAKTYWQRGIREGIAAILFKHRGESLPRFKTIPMIYESDVHAILREHDGEWKHSSGDEKPIILDTIVAELVKISVPQELAEIDEQSRRQAILKGEESARPADAQWLSEAVEAKRREMEELLGLLQPVGDKVNRGASEKVSAKGPGYISSGEPPVTTPASGPRTPGLADPL